MKTFNTTFKEELLILRELGEDALFGYKMFLEALTDANYHELKNEIEGRLLEEIKKRNIKTKY